MPAGGNPPGTGLRSSLWLGEPLIIRADLPENEQSILAERLLDAAEHEARRKGFTFCVRCACETGRIFPGVITSRDYPHLLDMPGAVLDIRWDSFDEYRRYLKQTHFNTEKTVRKEINQSKRLGLRFERLNDPGPEANILHRIMDHHSRRLAGKSFVFQQKFFDRIGLYLGDRAVIFAARQENKTVGILLALTDRESLFMPFVGINPERVRDGATYFNLVFNHPIQTAIDNNWRKIFCGRLLYDLKVRKGCRLIESSIHVRGRNIIHDTLLKPLFIRRPSWVRQMTDAVYPKQTSDN